MFNDNRKDYFPDIKLEEYYIELDFMLKQIYPIYKLFNIFLQKNR